MPILKTKSSPLSLSAQNSVFGQARENVTLDARIPAGLAGAVSAPDGGSAS